MFHSEAIDMAEHERPIISQSLIDRILETYPSNALEVHLRSGSTEAMIILGQLVHMNLNPERVMVLAQQGNTKAITEICKDSLAGKALLEELYRELYSIRLH